MVPGEVEAYVRASDLDDLFSEYGFVDAAGRPNVFLRGVEDASWPFDDDEHVAPRCVVAVDLYDFQPRPQANERGETVCHRFAQDDVKVDLLAPEGLRSLEHIRQVTVVYPENWSA